MGKFTRPRRPAGLRQVRTPRSIKFMEDKGFSENKKPPIPPDKEKKKFLDLEMEILGQIAKAIKGHRPMEAYLLGWSVIEQFMLPRLIRFVAGRLKVVIPKESLETNYVHLIKYYYFLTHDHELFLALDKGRKNRNKLTHELYKKNDWESIKKDFKKYLKKDIADIFSLFQKRFNGKTLIPVLTLYSSGWNDALHEVKKVIKGEN